MTLFFPSDEQVLISVEELFESFLYQLFSALSGGLVLKVKAPELIEEYWTRIYL